MQLLATVALDEGAHPKGGACPAVAHCDRLDLHLVAEQCERHQLWWPAEVLAQRPVSVPSASRTSRMRTASQPAASLRFTLSRGCWTLACPTPLRISAMRAQPTSSTPSSGSGPALPLVCSSRVTACGRWTWYTAPYQKPVPTPLSSDMMAMREPCR